MREAIKTIEDLETQPIENDEATKPSTIENNKVTEIPKTETIEVTDIPTKETNETTELSKNEYFGELCETPKQDSFSSEVPTNKPETNKSAITEPTSINMIEAINMSASIKEEPPPLSMGAAINMSAAINMIEVITVPTTKGETSIPNEILDGLLPLLDPTASLVYLRLYRLSHGFKSEYCTVGMNKLASSVNIGVATAERAVRKLESLRLIERVGANFGHGIKGNHYIVRRPNTSINMREATNMRDDLNMREAIKLSTPINLRNNKDHHDDDLKKEDHHQSEHEKAVMMIYQKITSNNWTKADLKSYEKVKSVPIEKIEVAIRLAKERSTNHPNSFAYFIKEILAVANPPQQSRSQRKKALEKIIDRVKTSRVGGSSYSISDLAYDVKEICVKEGVMFDHDLFNEAFEKKKS